MAALFHAVLLILWSALVAAETVVPAAEAPGRQNITVPALNCLPEQTGGFHDYPEGEESYEPALFHSRPFSLRENTVFQLNLQNQDGGPDLYLTLSMDNDPLERTELECRLVRGANGAMGLSCVNLPPSEMLLINTETYRFTRSAVGGWTFAGAAGDLSGDSIFIEYGQCQPTTEDQPINP